MSDAAFLFMIRFTTRDDRRHEVHVRAADPGSACELAAVRSSVNFNSDLLEIQDLFQVDRLGKEIKMRRLPVPEGWWA